MKKNLPIAMDNHVVIFEKFFYIFTFHAPLSTKPPNVQKKKIVIFIYIYIYTLAAVIFKIFEPNFNMLFLGPIVRTSSLMSKIGPRGWSGEGVEILKTLYLGPYEV